MRKRGQAWGFDLIMAFTIFLLGVILFYIYSINYPTESEEDLDSLFYDANFITDSLLSEGYPADWNDGNVLKIGLVDNNKINHTKLERMYNLVHTQNEYDKTRSIFNTKYDYFFNFSQDIIIGGIGTIEGIGKPFETEPYQNLVKTTRLGIYNDKPTIINFYIWEK